MMQNQSIVEIESGTCAKVLTLKRGQENKGFRIKEGVFMVKNISFFIIPNMHMLAVFTGTQIMFKVYML